MSLLRTLQMQPRVITVFAEHANVGAAPAILGALKSASGSRCKVQVNTMFPTLEQLTYMSEINREAVAAQIPQLSELLQKPSFSEVFCSPLEQCAEKGLWRSQGGLWVDWEKRLVGADGDSVRKLLGSSATATD
ncbi:AaceriAFL211Wp [[Ashbya] aceris (nom. inval.)]|nr:AaceriAFL211Wp [[Ashbya] aceris (nom. inval.)]